MSLAQHVSARSAPATAEPFYGGTVRVSTTEGLQPLEPAAAHGAATRQLLWATTRQLFACPGDGGRGHRPVADLAAGPATTPDGILWTVHLRQDVRWDTVPPRVVSAEDVVRGVRRLALPAARNPARSVLSDVIAVLDGRPLVCAAGPHTVVFELCRPVPDFVHLLAASGLAPAPAEYDAFPPGAAPPRSTGPYRPAAGGSGTVRLEHNPVWTAESDLLRARFADAIEVHADGRGGDATADLSWPAGASGGPTSTYLAVNLHGRLRDHAVRRAVVLAADRTRIAEVLAAPGVPSRVQHGIIPPGMPGHRPYDPWPTPGDRGDPGAAALALGPRRRNNPPVVVAVPGCPRRRRAADVLVANLAAAGLPATVRELPDGALHAMLGTSRSGGWDLAFCEWTPGEYADPGRELRSLIGDGGPGNRNYGGYHSDEVDRLVAEALREADPVRAEHLWHRVDRRVMRDLPVIPLVAETAPRDVRRSSRIRNVRMLAHLGRPDLTSVWLDG